MNVIRTCALAALALTRDDPMAKKKLPPKPVDPVHFWDGPPAGWYFWTDSVNRQGPYISQSAARAAYLRYCKSM